ncbi:hypothetical protein KRX57_00310 [Weeksellaceae bacterium TAE3-ERU29]|nr:hypothetical protein [Weeksellaceae bacterium TAE3-ERU29]
MKKQFYKLSTMFFLGLGAIAFGQQNGTVGINVEAPSATLEIRPSSDNAAPSATTNEGILVPKLTKERVANITDGNLVEGTMVYVEGATYSGSNDKVSKIDANGFYYYDNNIWVKVGDSSKSAVYRNARTDNGTSINISDADFFIHLTNQDGGTINVPVATTANNGRELCFFNSGSKGFATGALGNGASVQPSFATCIISVDGVWVTKSSY